MAWFGDGLSSLSNLKGQITNFTKEVLSEGIVNEIDERSRELEETNEKCVQLQELLNSKDAEIGLLRRQNCELKKTVAELQSRPRESNDERQDDEGGGFFWDPPAIKNREKKNNVGGLQDQIVQATLKIKELEDEVRRYQKINSVDKNDEEGHQRGEFLRAKQDMVNRIIQIGEKGRDIKKIQLDESAIVNDFRAAISKLDSHEQVNLIRCALSALEMDNGACGNEEKSDVGKKVNNDEAANGAINREAELCKKIKRLQEENKNLTTSIEELDQQHAQSIEKVLALKEELQKKHQCLQTAYEALYVDYNNLQGKQSPKESTSSTSKNIETQTHPVSTETQKNSEKMIQTDIEPTENLERITEKVQTILKNSNLKINVNESLFEALAREFVETQWKKEILERKINDVNRELKQSIEMRDALQIDCEDLQSTIDAMESEIQHMKSNLPSIPEGSEEQVASLETETESMSEEIKNLKSENDVLREKHSDLITTIANLEGSLRNQENLEAEVRNTKQQLEIVQQQLAGASRNVENNENVREDLRRCLHTSLDENTELRKQIDALEAREKEMHEEINIYSEKCKDLDDNIELIEELKLDIANARKELKDSFDHTKILENKLMNVEEAKKEIERDIIVLSREKEQLETELDLLQKNGNDNDDSDVLRDLRNQLNSANREKDDLEYDLMNMRRELDSALNEVSQIESQCLKLTQDNERLVTEHTTVLEQLGSMNQESAERIELLQTEMNLLQQEHTFLQEEAAADKSELSEIRLKLQELQSKNSDYEKHFEESEAQLQVLKSDCKNLQQRANKVSQLEEEVSRFDGVENELMNSKSTCKKLNIELAHLHDENEELRQSVVELSEKLKRFNGIDEKLRSYIKKCDELERELIVKSENSVNTDLSAELKTLKCELQDKSLKLEILEAEKDELVCEINAVKIELDSLKRNSDEAASMARETIDNLSQLIKQRDQEMTEKLEEKETALNTLKSERDELVKLVQVKHNESLQYHGEMQRMTQLFNEQVSTLQGLVSERDELSDRLKEKEAKILWGQNELQVVRQRLKNFEELNNYGETCNIPEHSSQIARAGVLNEKCNALEAALIKEQSSNRILQNQLTESQAKENTAAKELERLRTHLMEIEANYTEETLIMEENKKELEAKLRDAEEKVKNSSTVYTSASIRANQQVETLQQQMSLIIHQRDEIQSKLSAAEDKVLSHTASLTNLQIVLEQFQRDKENDIRNATERIRQQLNDSYKKQEELNAEISYLKGQLTEAKECLQAASRLSEQLDRKSDKIQELNQEVVKLTELVNTADERIREAKKSGEGKVDKVLVKNLLLGFLSSPTPDKSSVLRVFSTVLDFDELEREKAGLNHPAGGSWFSGLLSSGVPTKDQETSLSQAFVRFLESESKPTSVPALTISNTPISRPGHSRQHSTSSSHSGLLLTNVTLPSFPDFIPARNTGSILKEVLKDS